MGVQATVHSGHEAMQRAVLLSEKLQQAKYTNVQLEASCNDASSALSHTVACAKVGTRTCPGTCTVKIWKLLLLQSSE